MSQENIEVVRRGIDAFNRGEEAFDLLDPEIEWTTTGIFVEPRTRSGHEGVRQYLGSLADDFERVHVEPEELIAVDEHVIVPVRVTGRGRLSGVPVEVDATLLYSLRGGKIVRIRNYGDKAEALEAVGLAE